ncbi:MAG: succinate dehydrogenase, hydrophobic membrane anchor protein [Rhizobiales bacterium]|nr:succinate dehydrogenase, hydrophobic membrane anchor protein [Hyphomicrobiales bacterium]MBN9009507.1 succinate dehydrogenase, hydrophobic membrane anchor protein [Hyphomicrobiales bacterium]
MAGKSTMRTPLSRVLFLGAAHEGTTHFWRQRVTGAANAILSIAFIVLMLMVIGRPYAEVVATLSSPLAALILVLLFVSVAIHMRIGMQVVVEDYVHSEGLKLLALVGSTFFTIAVAAIGIFAVLKLAFGG